MPVLDDDFNQVLPNNVLSIFNAKVVILDLGVNFTKIVHAAFTHVDLESVKKIDNLTVILCFWDLRT